MRRRRSRQRETNDLANPSLLSEPLSASLVDTTVSLPDRRHWDPDEVIPPGPFLHDHDPLNFFSEPAAFVESPPGRASPQVPPLGHIPLGNTRQVSRAKAGVCVRRAQRREVLFALRRTGKGGRRNKRRRNRWSDYKC